MNKQLKVLAFTIICILGVAFIGSYVYHKAGIKPTVDSQNYNAQANERNPVDKQYMDRMNESNIDKIAKEQTGYRISMKPAQDEENNEVVKPKTMKVYKQSEGKLKDITDKGEISKDNNGSFIRWYYKSDKNKPVAKELKKDIGKNVVFDVTYDKPVKPNTATKEMQVVNKQIHDLNHKVQDDKSNNKEKALKKHEKLLKNSQKWKKDIKSDKKETHRYKHEIRYE
ncbi:TPA: hypothetical protein OVC47_001597 [Staphylococcus aureus]|nr:hypothetical protein [Staphylococcus aureus]HDJ7348171.1 hypothetical protein [Staphylococcus aureus]